MSVTEQQRHQLLTWFEERMDEERAATMMELLPPAGSDQLATKGDLAVLRAEIKTDLVGLQRALATWIFASQAGFVAVAAVLFTALR